MKKRAFVALVMLMVGTQSILALESNIAGVWKISGSLGGTPLDITCTIKQEGKKLSGTCKTSDGLEDSLAGEINDKKVQWKYLRNANGMEIAADFKGDLDEKGAAIAGKIDLPQFNLSGDFTAKKESAK